MMPLTTGLIAISLRGTMLPFATVFFTMVCRFALSVANSSGFSALFDQRNTIVPMKPTGMAMMRKYLMNFFMIRFRRGEVQRLLFSAKGVNSFDANGPNGGEKTSEQAANDQHGE